MDWSRIRRRMSKGRQPHGVYVSLDELVRLQFKARDFSFLPHQPVTSVLSGRYASRLRGRGLNFEELRHYHPGDDIRTMDWKVTARTREPYVRVYSEERDRTVMLMVDQRLGMFFGTRRQMKSVSAAEVAALASWRAVSAGDRVGGFVFNDVECDFHKPARSRGGVMSLLGSVTRMNHALRVDSSHSASPEALNDVLRRVHATVTHDALIVLISDFDGMDDESEGLISRLAGRNDIIAVHVQDPARSSLAASDVVVSDGVQRLSLPLSQGDLRRRLVEDHHVEDAELEGFLRRLTAPRLVIRTDEDVVAQVRRLFGVRPSR